MNNLPKGVSKFVGSSPGPTLAIFAGVHGDERAGILALDELLPKLEITRGILYVAFANQPAIAKNIRQVNKNLNRLFLKNIKGNSYEEKRAHELMLILDECDALLDLHQFKYTVGEPFVICEDSAIDIASIFDVGIISTNWTTAEPGAADGYMYEQGKMGICLECGSIAEAQKFKDLAIRSVKQSLAYFEMIEEQILFSTTEKRIIKAKESVLRTSKDFEMDATLYNFQKLSDGQIIGKQNTTVYKAIAGEYIIFPDPDASIGTEAWIIGQEQRYPALKSSLLN